MINLEEFRKFCLSLDGVTEKMPFGAFAKRYESILVFYVMDHMFCFVDIDDFHWVNLRSTPDEINEIKSEYTSTAAPVNQSLRFWIRLEFEGDIPPSRILDYIKRAYDIVKNKYSRTSTANKGQQRLKSSGKKSSESDMDIHKIITNEIFANRNEGTARILGKFFKTGKGDYGEGDKFLGVKVPQTRAIVKACRNFVTLEDIPPLINSPWHEIRLAGFLSLIEIYKRGKKDENDKEKLDAVNLYLLNIEKGNNWDLVDLVAPQLLGDYLVDNPDKENILDALSQTESLWSQRVAIVATFSFIKMGEFNKTLQLAHRYLTHKHDLIHKATGWMLREMGKRGGEKHLQDFLENYATRMPRTMLRYAIEKFSPSERFYYLKKK